MDDSNIMYIAMNILPLYNGDKNRVRNALGKWVSNVDPKQVDRVIDSMV